MLALSTTVSFVNTFPEVKAIFMSVISLSLTAKGLPSSLTLMKTVAVEQLATGKSLSQIV